MIILPELWLLLHQTCQGKSLAALHNFLLFTEFMATVGCHDLLETLHNLNPLHSSRLYLNCCPNGNLKRKVQGMVFNFRLQGINMSCTRIHADFTLLPCALRPCIQELHIITYGSGMIGLEKSIIYWVSEWCIRIPHHLRLILWWGLTTSLSEQCNLCSEQCLYQSVHQENPLHWCCRHQDEKSPSIPLSSLSSAPTLRYEGQDGLLQP